MQQQFLLDAMLGTLSTYLRMCGYDTLYALEDDLEGDDEIRTRTQSTNRTLLTRDRELARGTDDALLLHSLDIEDQLAELQVHGVRIELPTRTERCSVCNGRLSRLDPDRHPDHAPNDIATVWQCRECDQYFWKGSHWDRVQETINEIAANQSL